MLGYYYVWEVVLFVFVSVFNLLSIIQIADFGMARDLEDSDYYTSHGGQIPVKWTAPEVTTHTHAHAHAYNIT